MSSKPEIINAKGHGWRVWTGLRSGPMLDVQVALGCDAYLTLDLSTPAVVTVPIPLDLARRISGEPKIKLVSVDGAHHDLKPHWLRLIGMIQAAGMTSERKARDIASLFPDRRTPKTMQGAAAALARRGILGRVPVHPASHYWLTEKGLALVTS